MRFLRCAFFYPDAQFLFVWVYILGDWSRNWIRDICFFFLDISVCFMIAFSSLYPLQYPMPWCKFTVMKLSDNFNELDKFSNIINSIKSVSGAVFRTLTSTFIPSFLTQNYYIMSWSGFANGVYSEGVYIITFINIIFWVFIYLSNAQVMLLWVHITQFITQSLTPLFKSYQIRPCLYFLCSQSDKQFGKAVWGNAPRTGFLFCSYVCLFIFYWTPWGYICNSTASHLAGISCW